MDYPHTESNPPSTALHPPGAASVPPPAVTPAPVPLPAQPKLLSRNANGTIVWTSSPSNEAELQLYRVMQRASLLAYYDTLLEMGGDDVQQLCEAGEEEFLEIMALVGMASKPLHVRRLQKALQEWLTNPAMFRNPLVPGVGFSPRPVVPPTPPLVVSPVPTPPPLVAPLQLCSAKDTPPPPPRSTSPVMVDSGCPSGSPGGPSSGRPSPGPPGSPLAPPPVILEAQVSKLAEAAQHLVNTLPQMEPKSHTAKKKMNKDLELVLSMAEDDPRRMELIRKFAAIYGRFDCKRKPEKPLTLHEVSVNEAAAQICRFMPALLTRRDELFPLARQVVRDSGYHYSKGHSKSYSSKSAHNGDQVLTKRSRNDYSPETEESIRKRQERLDQIAEELRSVNERTLGLKGNDGAQGQVEALQSRQQALLVEQTQLVNQGLQPNRYSRRRVDSSSPQSIGTSTIHTPLTSPFISPVGSKAHTSPTFAFSSSGRGSAFSRFVASSLPIAGGLKSGQISPNCPPHQSPTGNGPVSNADLTPSFNVTVSSAGQLSPNVGNLMAGNTSAFNAVATSSPTVAVFTPTTLSLNSGSTLFTSSNVSAFNPVVTSAPNNSVALNNATHQLTAGNGSAFNSLVTTTPKTSDPIFIETSFNSAPHQTMQFSPTSVTPLSVTANGTYTVQSTLSRSNSVVGPVNGDSSAAIYLE